MSYRFNLRKKIRKKAIGQVNSSNSDKEAMRAPFQL